MSHKSSNPFLSHTLNHVKDIQTTLFELCHADSMTIVRNAAGHEIAVEILALDNAAQCFYWRPRDYAGSDFASSDQQGLLASSVLHFDGRSYGGIQIIFQVDRPQIVRADNGTPALRSHFPTSLIRVQRRGAFRVQLDGTRIAAHAIWQPDAEPNHFPLKFQIRDLSINGIGMRIEQSLATRLPVGSQMRRVTLHFDKHGDIQADLAVHNLYLLHAQSEKSSDTLVAHLGASFIGLDAHQTGRLQRIVWAIENARRQAFPLETKIWQVKP